MTAETAARTLQPNSRHCFVCGVENPVSLGLRFYETGRDEVTAEYTVPDRYQGYPGMVHGGVVAAMLDEVVGRAAMAGDPNRFMFTGRLCLTYRKPVPLGQPLRMVGRLVRRRGRAARATGELRLRDGTLAVEATATLIDVPGHTASQEELDALGWKVYPQGESSSAGE